MTITAPTVIVTGASRGLGRSIVLQAILSKDANVIGVARSKENLESLAHHIEHDLKLPNRFKFVVGDVTLESTTKEALALAADSWSGQVNGFVFNAGVVDPIARISHGATVDEWKNTFDINFFSIVSATQLALPALRESKGRLILVSSGAAVNPYVGWAAYCTSKAALKMFGECLAVEEPDVITVSIRPGVVDTDMQVFIRENGNLGASGMLPNQHAEFRNLKESQKLLHPDEPGHVIASLSVDATKGQSGNFYSWNADDIVAHRK
ncbi:hypothetical protein BGW38_002862 [Lunasporangiospora selenospora]|uniref:NAD(P)-binding protein n=1 Tax=Lunasporangiospora selenospora TaxID=979761 RepID=A0A9P6KD98_9FUNG|nr:hypothetical protein BGW38_002862 [Lunasporangiospora selenospora]